MSDLISRQAAIDAHYEYCNKHPNASFPVWSLKILEDLPPAQADSKELSGTHKALDTVSRQAAIDSMCELMRHWFGCDSKDEIREIKRELGKLPSAQPEIVRCKECTFYRSDGCFFSTAETEENGFCSWAERRTDEVD